MKNLSSSGNKFSSAIFKKERDYDEKVVNYSLQVWLHRSLV